MKKNIKKILSGVSSVAMLASAQAVVAETAYTVETATVTTYDEDANMNGTFTFNQDAVTPADSVFSLFGTVATGVCAKPAFAMDEAAPEASYYVNVSGKLDNPYTISLEELKNKGGEERTMVCSCATGSAVAQAQITGVPVSDMLQLAGIQDDVNAVVFKSADGYSSVLPLNYVLEKDAMAVWKIGEKDNPTGLQVWMPSTVAKYFTRELVEIEAIHSDEDLVVDAPADSQRAKVSIVNRLMDECPVGTTLSFSGYADDCGTSIKAVEFSLDGGQTWESYETKGAIPERWVAWEYSYTPKKAGNYKLDVRAVTEDGTVSPLAASVTYTVIDAD